MIQTLIPTKLQVPYPAPGQVERPRLHLRLDRGLEADCLTAVIAPAGYGKTTAVANWFHQAQGAHPGICLAWYTADGLDDDPRQFLRYLAGAVRRSVPGALPSTNLMLEDAPNQDHAQITAEFLREIALLSDTVALVIDDYHSLTHPAVHETLRTILSRRLSNLHLYLTSRHDPPLGLSSLRAQGRLNEIRTSTLAFNDAETLAFLQAAIGDDISEEVVGVLQERTEGWAVGLRLAAIPLRNAGERDDFLRTFQAHSHRHILDYLVEEVLEAQPPELRTFLLQTSLLNRFCADLCVAAGAAPDVPTALRYIENVVAQSLFVVPLDDENLWYRYHHQFQSMLQNRILLELEAAKVADTHDRAGAWWRRKGHHHEALFHYRPANNQEAISQVVEEVATDLENHDRWPDLRRLLAYVPDEAIQQRPGLLLPQIWSNLLRLEWSRIGPLLDHAEHLLAQMPPENEQTRRALLGEVSVLRGTSLFRSTALATRREYNLRALELLPRERSWARAYAFANLVYTETSPQEIEALVQFFNAEIAAVQADEDPYVVRLLQALGLIYFRYGTLDEIESTYGRFTTLAAERGMVSTEAYGHFGLGIAAYYRGETDSAIPNLERVLQYPYLVGAEVLLGTLYPLISLYHEAGQPERVDAALNRMRSALTSTQTTEELRALEAYAALMAGDLASAVRWADGIHSQAQYPLEVRSLILARIRLAQNDPTGLEQAELMLSDYLSALERSNDRRQRIHVLVSLASIEWARDCQPEALEHLAGALRMGYDRGYRRWFAENSPSLAAMYRALLGQNREVRAANALLQRLSEAAASPVAAEGIDPTGLTTREREILRLVAQNLTNKEIGRALGISELTVRNHLVKVFTKLGVDDRSGAVQSAQELGQI